MMGDQRNEGVIPKAVGEIYEYIEKVLVITKLNSQSFSRREELLSESFGVMFLW